MVRDRQTGRERVGDIKRLGKLGRIIKRLKSI